MFRGLSIVALLAMSCTAVSVSPPLNPRRADDGRPYGAVYLTSGEFAPAHEVIGQMQMTQTGYKWFHAVELNPDANPGSILWAVAEYARALGADGVQNLVILDLDPQTPAETAKKQFDTAVKLSDQVASGRSPTAAGEGTKTRYGVWGELIRFKR